VKFTSARQLKDWIKNKSKKIGTPANTLLQTYMMERLLERISLSVYHDNMILKGGFLIASMIGVDKRSTKDMDTTLLGLPVNRNEIEVIIKEIISIEINDGVSFKVLSIENIHEEGEYDDFRIMLQAEFFTIREYMKIDITVGDSIIPHQISYPYKLLLENRTIPVMAYNLYNILAEKIETILSRNVANSRGRDFYDVYILLLLNKETISRDELLRAIRLKSEERNTVTNIVNYNKHLDDISVSPEIAKIWTAYVDNYPYAKGITLSDSITLIKWVFKGLENSCVTEIPKQEIYISEN